MNEKKPAGQQTIEVLTNPSALASATPDELRDALARRDLLIDTLRDAGLKSTRSDQWCDMDGKPWPTAAAAETIARRCAVKIHDTHYKREDSRDDEGPFYFYVYVGTLELPGGLDSAEVPGTCSSRDQFIGTKAAGGRELSEINEDDIMKAAYSNLEVNGIMRLLACRGLTWEFLKDYGLDPEKAQKIEHKKGGKGGSVKLPHAERLLPFGKSEGKTLSDPAVGDNDFKYYRSRFEASAADPEKAKWKEDNLAWVKAIDEELARRANTKAGVAPSNGHAEAPTPWARICALPEAKGLPAGDMKAIVKAATNKSNSGELDDADVVKVQAALKQRKAKRPEDNISFD